MGNLAIKFFVVVECVGARVWARVCVVGSIGPSFKLQLNTRFLFFSDALDALTYVDCFLNLRHSLRYITILQITLL